MRHKQPRTEEGSKGPMILQVRLITNSFFIPRWLAHQCVLYKSVQCCDLRKVGGGGAALFVGKPRRSLRSPYIVFYGFLSPQFVKDGLKRGKHSRCISDHILDKSFSLTEEFLYSRIVQQYTSVRPLDQWPTE